MRGDLCMLCVLTFVIVCRAVGTAVNEDSKSVYAVRMETQAEPHHNQARQRSSFKYIKLERFSIKSGMILGF